MNRETFDQQLQASTAAYYLQAGRMQFDSPIEQVLAWSLGKHLRLSQPNPARLVPQAVIPTRLGTFRGDFVLHTPGLNTLIECDGRDFHLDPFEDALRSALILESGLVDQVIRFNGSMLSHAPDDGAFFTALVHPAAFEDSAPRVLALKATPEARQLAERTKGSAFDFDYEVSVLTEDEEYDMDGNHERRRVTFKTEFHAGAAGGGRIARLIFLAKTLQPSSKAELEHAYVQPDEGLIRLVDKIHEGIHVGTPEDPMLKDCPDVFETQIARLELHFQKRLTPEMRQQYFIFLGNKVQVSWFEAGCQMSLRSERFFPSVIVLKNNAEASRWAKRRS